MENAYQPPPQLPKTSAMAITSLVLGISSFLCLVITGIPAIIVGIIALVKVNNSRGAVTGSGLAIGGIVTGVLSSLMIVPILIALLLPAVQAAREAARANMSLNNTKHILLAMHNHHDVVGQLPAAGTEFPAAGTDDQGVGPQLSWRVHLLPYMEGGPALYEQFHLDEPWDSEHNRQLIPLMPEVYNSPSLASSDGTTVYLAVTGPGTAFQGGTVGPKFRDFSDGTSNTILIVEADADQAVPWTKPVDWTFDPQDPMRGLGNLRAIGFIAGFADGHAARIESNIDPEVLRAMMTRDGRETVNW